MGKHITACIIPYERLYAHNATVGNCRRVISFLMTSLGKSPFTSAGSYPNRGGVRGSVRGWKHGRSGHEEIPGKYVYRAPANDVIWICQAYGIMSNRV